jgi:lysophospholipase L1-like esterase
MNSLRLELQKLRMRKSIRPNWNPRIPSGPKETDMRIRLVTLIALLLLCGLTLTLTAAAQTYYVALGDSLAVGYQPINGGGPTNQGYADDLFNLYRSHIPGLTLTKLGCAGETTSSMVQGGVCPNYTAGSSQLNEAISFLQTHQNQVALVTLDIGANDVDGCVTSTNIDQTCIESGFASVNANLPWILRELRQAAGPNTLIVAMNYYDPFLAAWELGSAGQSIALQSLTAATDFNLLLGAIYGVFDVPVADVAQAFRIYNFLPVPGEKIPVNVFLTLSWTYMSAPPPTGPDIHPTPAGYTAIAGAFARKIKLP